MINVDTVTHCCAQSKLHEHPVLQHHGPPDPMENHWAPETLRHLIQRRGNRAPGRYYRTDPHIWMDSVNLGASRSTIERNTLIDKYKKRVSFCENLLTLSLRLLLATLIYLFCCLFGIQESKVSSENGESSREAQSSDDKCTICLSEYEEDEDVR